MIELTKEQEEVLLKIIQREIDAPIIAAEIAQKEADLAEVHERLAEAKREADWAVTNSFIPELNAKQKALEDAKSAVSAEVIK